MVCWFVIAFMIDLYEASSQYERHEDPAPGSELAVDLVCDATQRKFTSGPP